MHTCIGLVLCSVFVFNLLFTLFFFLLLSLVGVVLLALAHISGNNFN